MNEDICSCFPAYIHQSITILHSITPVHCIFILFVLSIRAVGVNSMHWLDGEKDKRVQWMRSVEISSPRVSSKLEQQ